jgi:hypothetical protein
MTGKTLYEIDEVMKRNGGPLPMSKAGLYKACADGTIPSVRVGRRVFIPSWYVDSLLEKPN